MDRQFDQIARLLLLQGAFDLRPMFPGTRDPATYLRKLRDRVLPEQPGIHPTWFTEKDTGIWTRVRKQVEAILGRTEEAHDLLVDFLFGLQADLGRGRIPAWEAGHKWAAREQILNGGGPDQWAAFKDLLLWAHRRAGVKLETRRRRARLLQAVPPDPAVSPEPPTAARLLVEALLLTNDLGEALRQKMKASWKGSAQGETMDLWLDAFCTGNPVQKTVLAKRLGVTEAAISTRWQVGMTKAYLAIAADATFLRMLRQAGLEIDPSMTEGVFKGLSLVRDTMFPSSGK